MNKRIIKKISLIALAVMILGAVMSGCGESKDLASYVGKDEAYMKEINKVIEDSGLKASISDNDLNLVYESDMTLQGEMKDAMKEQGESFVKENGDSLQQLADKISKDTKIKDIKVNLIFRDKDGNEIYKKTFTSK